MTTVRIATEADVLALFDIRTSVRENHMTLEELAAVGVTHESIPEMLRTTSRAWVAEVDGADAAFAMADAELGTVFAMFVRPGYEGHGLGRRLMDEAEGWLFEQGWDEIWLLTGSDPKIRANGFYRHLGWTDVGVQPDGQIKYVKRREGDDHHHDGRRG